MVQGYCIGGACDLALACDLILASESQTTRLCELRTSIPLETLRAIKASMYRVSEPVLLHLACCTPNLKVVEYLGVAEEADRVWYTEFPEPRDGYWSPYPDRPGLGLELRRDAVERYVV